jgi:hypothetical protein
MSALRSVGLLYVLSSTPAGHSVNMNDEDLRPDTVQLFSHPDPLQFSAQYRKIISINRSLFNQALG